jgi:predicted ATPase with chaperone activity
MPGILPEMSIEESLDVTSIYSVADQLPAGMPLIRHRPFRAPHHTISHAGLVGGGNIPKPGEISLAHARDIQNKRFSSNASDIVCNADMRVGEIRQFCKLQDEGQRLMRAAMTQMNLSARLSPHPETGAHDCRSGGE